MTHYPPDPTPQPEPPSLRFATAEGPALVLSNPYRGTLIVGAPGSGKTDSLVRPMAAQLAAYGLAGLTYSTAEALSPTETPPGGPVSHRHLDFYHFGRSEKVNPLHPSLLDSAQDAFYLASSLLGSLISPAPGPLSLRNNFFTETCASYLAGIIWYYRQHHPALCTLPHVLATVQYDDFTHVLSMLSRDEDCLALVQSLVTGVRQGAEKQIASLVAGLHLDTSALLYPELVWLLYPDEALGEGFSLNLNDPAHPTQLTITTHPELAGPYAPVITCVIAAALRQMARPGKLPSYAVLDDAHTLYLPELVSLSAASRRNELALVYVLPALAPLITVYGIDSAQWILTNLGNHFFGEPAVLAEATRLVNYLKSDVFVANALAENALMAKDFIAQPGAFMGQFAATGSPVFRRVLRTPAGAPVSASVSASVSAPADRPDVSAALSGAMNEKLALVHRQVAETLGGYPNGLSRENRQGQ